MASLAAVLEFSLWSVALTPYFLHYPTVLNLTHIQKTYPDTGPLRHCCWECKTVYRHFLKKTNHDSAPSCKAALHRKAGPRRSASYICVGVSVLNLQTSVQEDIFYEMVLQFLFMLHHSPKWLCYAKTEKKSWSLGLDLLWAPRIWVLCHSSTTGNLLIWNIN